MAVTTPSLNSKETDRVALDGVGYDQTHLCVSSLISVLLSLPIKPLSSAWVMCGRRPIDKSFFTLMQHWSGAVMCPAC